MGKYTEIQNYNITLEFRKHLFPSKSWLLIGRGVKLCDLNEEQWREESKGRIVWNHSPSWFYF